MKALYTPSSSNTDLLSKDSKGKRKNKNMDDGTVKLVEENKHQSKQSWGWANTPDSLQKSDMKLRFGDPLLFKKIVSSNSRKIDLR